MSNEQQPSFRERATNAPPPPPPFNATMAPTIHRWLNADKTTRHSSNMDSSNSNLTTKAAPTASNGIWRHRNGPWDELLGKRQTPSHQQRQQHHQRRESTHMGLESQGSQLSAIPNLPTSNPPTPAAHKTTASVRSLRNYYTELQQQKQHSWNQQQSELSSTMLTPRMKRLQSQQFYHHSHHRSMDTSHHPLPCKEIPKLPKIEGFSQNRFRQFPTSPPPPPQRLASIVPLQTSNYCIN